MENDYHSIRWITPNIATRITREVNIKCVITNDVPFNKDGSDINGWGIVITGTGDTEHHLVEDASILLKKICESKCGGWHG